jgi:hypothetical protein
MVESLRIGIQHAREDPRARPSLAREVRRAGGVSRCCGGPCHPAQDLPVTEVCVWAETGSRHNFPDSRQRWDRRPVSETRLHIPRIHLQRLVKLPPHMRKAAGSPDTLAAHLVVGRVSVGLQDALVVFQKLPRTVASTVHAKVVHHGGPYRRRLVPVARCGPPRTQAGRLPVNLSPVSPLDYDDHPL